MITRLIGLLRIEHRLVALEERVLKMLAELWHRCQVAGHVERGDDLMDEIMRTRLLFSFDRNMKTHHVRVTGTQAQIEAAAQRLARRTKSCVMVAVIVANYHTRGCEEHPRGGYREDGD
jgi:hypothetical protein